MNPTLRFCFLATLVSACGSSPPPGMTSLSSSSSAEQGRSGGGEGMLVCDIPLLPVDEATRLYLIRGLERDRVYESHRPGFMRQWIPIGRRAGGDLWGGLVAMFETTAGAEAYSSWLDNVYDLDGIKFWDRPFFQLGHECHVWEVLAGEDRPSTDATQAMLRIERFPVAGVDPRAQLRDWFKQVEVESHRRGNTSVKLLYSEAQQMASLVYFGGVPRSQRDPGTIPPISGPPPLGQGSSYDWSAWTVTVWFPFETGDHGRAALWPTPGFEAWAGDGICEPSRHETVHTTTDCLATCGNGTQDPGEDDDNCPADVDQYP